MCGIFAASASARWVAAGVDAMRYRGPDEQRVVATSGFALGFARLAIMDTQAPEASQPYRSKRGRTIAFNGELYNYRALWREAPSEVALLAALLDEGKDPRQFLDGDYAIVDHDPTHRRVTLYRDRFGVCPLYYQLRPFFAVSSESRFLLHPIEVRPHERIRFRYLPPASEREGGKARIEERSQLPHYGLVSDPISLSTFTELFLQAVQSRAKHSEVGFSVTCSGGLDSSAVVLALRTLGLRPAALLCVSSGETEDLRYAREVAQLCRWKLTELQVTEEQLAMDHEDILVHSDSSQLTGLSWRVAVRNWYVAKAAPTRVVLTGEGADELFEGYPPHPERLKLPYRIAHKQLSALRSLPFCSLNLSNKIGLAHSKEFRAPFLQSTLSYLLLACQTGHNKELLRRFLRSMGASPELVARSKWGTNEQRLDSSFKGAL